MSATHRQSRRTAWYQVDEEGFIPSRGVPTTIVAHEPENETVDTGLLDKDGRPIHRSLRRPIGFIDFGRR